MKKLRILMLLTLMILTGCQSQDIYKEENGKTKFVISLNKKDKEYCEQYSKEFNQEIPIILKKLPDNEEYNIILNKENNFSETIYLQEGKYSIEPDNENIAGEAKVSKTSLNAKGKESKITVTLKDRTLFLQPVSKEKISSKILKTDINSGYFQYQGKTYKLSMNVTKLLDIDHDLSYSSDTLSSGETKTITSQNASYEVCNFDNESQDIDNCTVISINTTNNDFVFPKGVMIGTEIKGVFDTYGEPDCLEGWASLTKNKKYNIKSSIQYTPKGLDGSTNLVITYQNVKGGSVSSIYYRHYE